jgi:MSHA biogenesis protein MshI
MRLFKKPLKTDGWLALVLHGEHVAAARIAHGAGGKPVVKLATVLTGAAASAEALEKAGKSLLANTCQVSTVLSGGHYQMLSVDAPNVPQDELRTAVRWRLKDMLDFHVDDATIDVLDIPVDKADARQHAMFAVAARNTVIEARQKLFAQAKIQLVAIDIPEMAQRNISALLETEGRGLAMLSFDADGGLLTVSYKGELYLARRIDVTLEQLLDADHDRKHQRFEKITLELQRSLDHFDRQFHFISVARLALAPSPITGLDEYLSSNLYTPVARFDLADVFDTSAVPELTALDVQQRLFTALGAALRHEEVVL